MSTLTTATATPFDAIRQTRPDGSEFWSARDLANVMQYDQWRNFAAAIDRAIVSISNQGGIAVDHVAAASKKVFIGSGADRALPDFHLTRFGAYMVVMNGDPRKPEIAAAQAYFAIRTREAETARPEMPTHSEALRGWALELEAREALEERNVVLSGQVAQLEPSASAWDELAAADGDYDTRAAAQILCRAGIDTGQNRLRQSLRQIGWTDSRNRPYQRHVGCGRLAERVTNWTDPATGDERVSYQLRITPKGLGELRALLAAPRLAVLPGGQP